MENLPKNVYEKTNKEKSIGEVTEDNNIITATTDIKNYTYTLINGLVYMRENSEMILQENISQKQKKIIESLLMM